MVQITSFLIISTAKSRKKKSLIPNKEEAEWNNKKIKEHEIECEKAKAKLGNKAYSLKGTQSELGNVRDERNNEKFDQQVTKEQENARKEALEQK